MSLRNLQELADQNPATCGNFVISDQDWSLSNQKNKVKNPVISTQTQGTLSAS